MKRYGGLFQKVIEFENLLGASRRVLRGKKGKKSACQFYFNLENEIIDIQKELAGGFYKPREYRIFEITDPKPRKISSSNIRDRVVHHAVCEILGPIFDGKLIHDSYACRTGKGSHAALRRGQLFSRRFSYYLKCDIKKYFESVDHSILKYLLSHP